MAGPWEAYQEQGPWTKFAGAPAAPADYGALDVFKQAQTSNPTPHTGFSAQVGRAFSGEGEKPMPAVPTLSEIGRQWRDAAGGLATGIATGAPGTPGNIEGLGRAGLRAVGAPVSADTTFPTSSAFGNGIAGKPSSPEAAFGRGVGEMAGPWAYGKLASHVIGPLLKTWAGLRTGAGSSAVQQAFDAGVNGGEQGAAFTSNMRGAVSPGDAVDTAKEALGNLYKQRSQAYQDAMSSGVISDPKILDFQPIKDAVLKNADVGTYKGVSLSKSAEKVRSAVNDALDEWQALPPDQFHTAEGLDALKKKLGDLQFEGELASSAQRGSPGAKIINGVRNAVKQQIVTNFPAYAEVMKDYGNASEELYNIERGLSLGDKASVDTSMGKLQSLMRNDVNSRFGGRMVMGGKLNDAGNGTLLPALAGQSLSSTYPRGLNRALSSGEAGAMLPAAVMHPGLLPVLGTDLVTSSPRVVGEVARGLGVLSRPFKQGAGATNVSRLAPMAPSVLARLFANQTPQLPR